MIFNVPKHIEMIRAGLYAILSDGAGRPTTIVKTETRRLNRYIYQVESERKKPHKIGYAVQRKRGVKAEPDIRIVFEKIWEEKPSNFLIAKDDEAYPGEIIITKESAWSEGGYMPEEYEKVFRELNPKWDGWSRWVFEFHVIKTEDEMLSMNKEEAIMEKCCFTCANYRKTCFHGPANLSNFTEEECKRSGPPFYRHIESKEMKNDRKQNC